MLIKQFTPTSLQTFANMLCDVLLFLLLRAMPVAASTSNMNNGSRKRMESPWTTMNSTIKSTKQEWSNATTISAKLDHHIGGSIFLEPISPHDGMIFTTVLSPKSQRGSLQRIQRFRESAQSQTRPTPKWVLPPGIPENSLHQDSCLILIPYQSLWFIACFILPWKVPPLEKTSIS